MFADVFAYEFKNISLLLPNSLKYLRNVIWKPIIFRTEISSEN